MLENIDRGGSLIHVIDTSVILSDPNCLEKLSDKDVVIPLVVISELESKRNHSDLGYAARCALRKLESIRSEFKDISSPIKTGCGGSIHIEVNNINQSNLPEVFQSDRNDSRILAVVKNLSENSETVLYSKDLPLRLKASVVGVDSEDPDLNSIDVDWSGSDTLEVDSDIIDSLYSNGTVELKTKLPINTCLKLTSGNKSALGRVITRTKVKLIQDRKIFGIVGKSAEQRFATDLLTDPKVGIVSLAGSAGTGKTTLALAAGLDSVIEDQAHKKVTIFRPIYPVGGQDIGFLPGDSNEKMLPWTQAILDSLESFCDDIVIDHIIQEDKIEVLPLTHIRGRTLSNSYVIIEEAQNLDSMVLLTALSRIGQNSKVVLTHDISQRDNLRVGKYDGISSVVSKLADNKLFGHITLTRTERSAIAELASTLLE